MTCSADDAAAGAKKIPWREPSALSTSSSRPREPRSPAKDRRPWAETPVDDQGIGALTSEAESELEIFAIVDDRGLHFTESRNHRSSGVIVKFVLHYLAVG